MLKRTLSITISHNGLQKVYVLAPPRQVDRIFTLDDGDGIYRNGGVRNADTGQLG